MRSILLVVGLCGAVAVAQESTLRGHVTSRGTRDDVPLASISIDDGGVVLEADAEGQFEARLAPGSHQVVVKAAGHQPGTFTETLEPNVELSVDYRLVRLLQSPYETQIRARSDRAEQARIQLAGPELQEVAGTAGEPLRVVTLLPGVSTPMSGLSYPIVRGSVPAASGYFLDGVQLPQLYHLAVGPSVINADFIDQVDFFPSNAPVRFSRVTAGVISATVARPRDDRVHATATADLLSSSAFLEVPIAKTGTHITLAGRISYTGALISLIGPLVSNGQKPVADFYDYQARIEQKLGPATLRLLTLGSSDLLGVYTDHNQSSGFMTSRFYKTDLRAVVPLGPGTFELGATAGYESGGMFGDRDGKRALSFLMGRTTVSGRARYRLDSEHWQLKLGLDAERQNSEISLSVSADPATQPFGHPAVGVFAGGFAEGAYLNDRLEVVAGVRVDNYVYAGHTSRIGVDPRLEARVAVTPWLKLDASIGLYHQAPTLLVTLPVTDMADLANGLHEVLQTSLGTDWSLPLGLTLSVSGYYNRITQARERSLAEFLSSTPTIDTALAGSRTGRSYGLEVMLRLPAKGRFFGWATYSLMRSERMRRFALFDANQDIVTQSEGMLPFAFDQTHVFNLVAGVQLPRGWKVGGAIHINSGRPETGEFSSRTMVRNAEGTGWAPVPLSQVDRLPAFFRLDARVSKEIVFEQYTLELYLDVLNITGREEVLGFSYNYSSTAGSTSLSRDPQAVPLFYPTIGVKGTY